LTDWTHNRTATAADAASELMNLGRQGHPLSWRLWVRIACEVGPEGKVLR
jgi:hypothetical protein